MATPEQMLAAVHAYVAAFDAGDPEMAVAIFAEDAVVEDPVGSPLKRGHDEIRAFYVASMATGAKLVAFNIQDTGGTAKTVARGIDEVKKLLPWANRVKREPVPARHLVVGLQCGGSDGYSGISANPALGAAVDRLVRHGGTAILSETPEIYGGEHLLTRRAASPGVADKTAREPASGRLGDARRAQEKRQCHGISQA